MGGVTKRALNVDVQQCADRLRKLAAGRYRRPQSIPVSACLSVSSVYLFHNCVFLVGLSIERSIDLSNGACYSCTYIHACMHACMHYTHTCMCIYICIYTHAYVDAPIQLNKYVPISTSIILCIYT